MSQLLPQVQGQKRRSPVCAVVFMTARKSAEGDAHRGLSPLWEFDVFDRRSSVLEVFREFGGRE